VNTTAWSERERLLDALLEELAEKGYADADLTDATRRAGIGEDVANEFEDKDECLFLAYGRLTKRLADRLAASCDPGDEWPRRIQGGLEALLSELAADPPMAEVVARTFPAIRPAAYARYLSFLESLAPCFAEGRALAEESEELPREVEMLAVGAAESIIYEEIVAGRTEALPSLMPSILFSVLVPFIGPERASAAMGEAGQAPA
jgi:AcrR family transcriptional regulator